MQVSKKQKLVYKVKQNDTINSICHNFKVLEEDIFALNKTSKITPNQLIVLPKSYSQVYVVQPLDTYQKISCKLGVSEEIIKEKTKNKKMFIGQKIVF